VMESAATARNELMTPVSCAPIGAVDVRLLPCFKPLPIPRASIAR